MIANKKKSLIAKLRGISRKLDSRGEGFYGAFRDARKVALCRRLRGLPFGVVEKERGRTPEREHDVLKISPTGNHDIAEEESQLLSRRGLEEAYRRQGREAREGGAATCGDYYEAASAFHLTRKI